MPVDLGISVYSILLYCSFSGFPFNLEMIKLQPDTLSKLHTSSNSEAEALKYKYMTALNTLHFFALRPNNGKFICKAVKVCVLWYEAQKPQQHWWWKFSEWMSLWSLFGHYKADFIKHEVFVNTGGNISVSMGWGCWKEILKWHVMMNKNLAVLFFRVF